MKGVSRSFWSVVVLVVLVEIFVGVLVEKSLRNDLICWTPGLKNHGYAKAACGSRAAFVGYQSWIPAVAVLLLFAATLVAGIATFGIQWVRTKNALRQFGAQILGPANLLQLETDLGIKIRVCDDRRCFCCCAGFAFPVVLISSGMIEILDEAQLAAVLAHESEHVRRRDPARALAVRCASNALFYIPLARHLSKKALIASELGADSVAAQLAGRAQLVRALLQVLGRVRPALGTVSEMASLEALDVRIEALRTNALPSVRPKLIVLFATLAVLAGLVLLGVLLPHTASLTLRPVLVNGGR
jgi:Zn-dependent protease with chaperone function